jgi:hypothetical protein
MGIAGIHVLWRDHLEMIFPFLPFPISPPYTSRKWADVMLKDNLQLQRSRSVAAIPNAQPNQKSRPPISTREVFDLENMIILGEFARQFLADPRKTSNSTCSTGGKYSWVRQT